VEELKSSAYHPEVVKEAISLGTGKEPTMCGTCHKGSGCLVYGSVLIDIGIDLPKAPNNFGEVLAGVLDLKVVQVLESLGSTLVNV
jgi:translation initiation factor 4G